MPEILIICTANQCRSPMAEGILLDLLNRKKENHGLDVQSAGIWGKEGIGTASNAILVLKDMGIDISKHRSRIIDKELIDSANIILVMEQGQKEAIIFEYPSVKSRTILLSELSGQIYDIRDPMGKPIGEFIKTAEMIKMIFVNGLENLINKLNS